MFKFGPKSQVAYGLVQNEEAAILREQMKNRQWWVEWNQMGGYKTCDYCCGSRNHWSDSAKRMKLLKCQGCKKALYCSELCQKKHWNQKEEGHKEKCKKN